MSNLQERLKELREEKNLSFDQLAKQTKLSSSSLCRWENGQSDIKSQYLIILSKFYGVTIEYLLGLED